MKNKIKLLNNRVLVLDGATGTQLQKRGMPSGVSPEVWCLRNPKVISAIHADYQKAGAEIVYTSTFGANRIKLKFYGNYNVGKVNKDLALIAKKAVKNKALVAGGIGPTGKFVEPFGPLKFEEAVEIFKEQAKGLLLAGVDLFIIETMMDIQEARAALIAVKELTDKFTMVTMTYELDGRTLNGTDPLTALNTLQSLGADAVGCNCSAGPGQMVKFIKAMKPYAKVPLIAKPNAGMPKLVKGKISFDMGPEKFASFAKELVSAGASLLGGCCGTTPEHIRKVKREVSGLKPVALSKKSVGLLSSARRSVILKGRKSLTIIGEAINPTGKKILQKELRQGKTSFIRYLAKEQEKAGASLLDVNVGIAGIDEVKTLKRIINMLAVNSSLPLVIDSSRGEAIETALRVYPGRALINSISGQKNKLKKLLSLAAKYGAMFILLPLEGKSLPKSFQERKKIILDILKEAKKIGFSKDDIIVDAMTLAVSSHPKAALETLKTIDWVSNNVKCNSVVGLSNISFGLPKRNIINAAFLALAKKKGLSLAIANPSKLKVRYSKLAESLLLGKDKDAKAFLAYFSKAPKEKKEVKISLSAEEKVFQAIIEGNREDVKEFTREAVSFDCKASEFVRKVMIPAINKVGDLFDKKEYFLPQLIASAETMKLALLELQPYLKEDDLKRGKKTVVFLATVKGDIHDIGKNIVALMLKNYGFDVVDLGKDVSAERIIKEIKRQKFSIVGLSSLMTTTMVNMKEVIDEAKRQGLNCRFIVGGAVVTRSFARSIGAEYANDSIEAVRVAKKLN
ncbi:MAG: homocysteine S-methyltransferase family protein [Candidatus Omnitrophica bacterium]|nr:homocysteine S-methyltransferase family protein [Candidatus Omnitrophota bacterium]MBU1134245.1 homocysteine S-methyltransferase family protein [Candidatus Omnitrophota bacterium]MBU1367557.1 homocysteine S-methyltransferase family protein [Candidatus Omnitrophota bacterium]MBU1523727.1 homocysteine S-methyltransferase family protein [Candidatus Omnitrophota bacterium]MBU1810428.1 homocysteine S-methyltransferase family protein [Candidatus Omnitrophota bacterium]